MELTYIILIALAVFVVYIIFIYNKLVQVRNQTDESWSDIDVQLKRRHDLIPNLVETVKGYASHEKQVFENVTKARAAAMGAQTPGEIAQTENMLMGTLKSLFAVAENYPDLKASANFAKLQDELSDTENKIQASRRFYNSMVRDMNTALQVFPQNIIANMLHLKEREFFEIENTEERKNVEVKF